MLEHMLHKISFLWSIAALRLTVVTGWTVPPHSISRCQAHQQQPIAVVESFRPNRRSSRKTIFPYSKKTTCPLKSSSTRSATITDESTAANSGDTFFYPVFSFAESPLETVEKFGRIDDVIMGGISNSALMPATATDDDTTTGGLSYAKWFGNIRIDGGGFCGIRTLPFIDALNVTKMGAAADGFYITCCLVSDNEPERRVWKMSTRVKPDRGEQLYQARFELPRGTKDGNENKNKKNDDENSSWAVIQIPFDDFKLVRGPRTVLNGPALNVTTGIYQIGLIVSKFEMNENITELENFRAGFFEMHVKEIGIYGTKKATNGQNAAAQANGHLIVESPAILTKQEAEKKRPLIAKVLLPVAKLFFSERAQRRKSAMKLLQNKRGLSRLGAIMFGIRVRARSFGVVSSLATTIAILSMDSFRNIFFLTVRICIVYPIRSVRALVMLFTPPLQRIQRKSKTE